MDEAKIIVGNSGEMESGESSKLGGAQYGPWHAELLSDHGQGWR